DDQARLGDKLGARPLQRAGTLGESGQRVELRQGAGRVLHESQPVDELRQNGLVQLLLTRQAAVACAQDLVLEALELLRDEALGGFDGLSPDVILRHTFGVLASDLDEKSLHPVVAELESRNARALAFAALE